MFNIYELALAVVEGAAQGARQVTGSTQQAAATDKCTQLHQGPQGHSYVVVGCLLNYPLRVSNSRRLAAPQVQPSAARLQHK